MIGDDDSRAHGSSDQTMVAQVYLSPHKIQSRNLLGSLWLLCVVTMNVHCLWPHTIRWQVVWTVVFCIMTPCGIVGTCQCFRGTSLTAYKTTCDTKDYIPHFNQHENARSHYLILCIHYDDPVWDIIKQNAEENWQREHFLSMIIPSSKTRGKFRLLYETEAFQNSITHPIIWACPDRLFLVQIHEEMFAGKDNHKCTQAWFRLQMRLLLWGN